MSREVAIPGPLEVLARIRVPHVITLLTAVILLVSVATWLVPSGRYTRREVQVGGMTREAVVPGSYEVVPKARSWAALGFGASDPGQGRAEPVGLGGFLTAIPRGLEESADIVFFIFIIGGVFGILQRSGTILAVIGWVTHRFADRAPVAIVLVGVGMAIGGSTLGMSEELIPLVPVFLMLARRLGYDRLFGLAVVVLAPGIGFAAATTNPFTVNVAQSIAELPLNSGWPLRVAFFVLAITVTLAYVLRYGARVKADPSRSLVDPDDAPGASVDEDALIPLRPRHVAIVTACIAIFAGIMWSVQNLGWWLEDMAGGFLGMGLVAGALGRLSVRETTYAFVDGMRDMVVAALVVGFARGIVVVMDDALILDTVVHAAATLLEGTSPHVGAQGMLVFQTTLNFFVPSGSGQAAVTMPLMAPLADLLGITRQTAVFAFQCGDGFSNMVIPTSGTLMAMLLMGRVDYETWLRFVAPLVGQLLVLSAVFLAVAVAIGYR